MLKVESTTSATTLTQSPDGVKIRRLINDRGGLYFRDHELKSLETTIKMRMAATQTSSLASYMTHLADGRGDEFRDLLNALTIRHTYFFRNEPQFTALREYVLPTCIQRKRDQAGQRIPSLRIWSAGCSTGEEPYSLAMVLHDLLPDRDRWNIQIVATDVSTEALNTARQASYGAMAMHLVSPMHRAHYFTELPVRGGESRYQVCEQIRQGVEFRYLNLLDADFPQDIDILFCRNVMIYFDLPTVAKLVDRFSRSLQDTGVLFIGYSETLQHLKTDLQLAAHKDGVYYSKKAAPERFSVQTDAQALSERVPPVLRKADLAAIEEAFHSKAYDQALRLVRQVKPEQAEAVEAYYLAAMIYTNQGDYAQADVWIDKIQAIDPLFAPAYYLRGTLALEQEDHEAARADLRKALYLDSNFAMAHMFLAVSYRDKEEFVEAIHAFKRAIKIMDGQTLEEEVAHAGGFNHGTLMSLCRNNIERLQNAL